MIMLTPGHRQIEANCILFPVSFVLGFHCINICVG